MSGSDPEDLGDVNFTVVDPGLLPQVEDIARDPKLFRTFIPVWFSHL